MFVFEKLVWIGVNLKFVWRSFTFTFCNARPINESDSIELQTITKQILQFVFKSEFPATLAHLKVVVILYAFIVAFIFTFACLEGVRAYATSRKVESCSGAKLLQLAGVHVSKWPSSRRSTWRSLLY